MKTVICFGDSNTHGTLPMRQFGEFKRYPADVRWPGVFAATIGKGWQVIEEGHPGRTTLHDDPIEGAHKNGLPALQVALETHRPIDVVIVMLGTNDLKMRYSVTAVDIAVSVEKLVTMIDASQAGPNGTAPKVMIVAPPPILETGILAKIFEDGMAKSVELAKHYKAVADRRNCVFLDAGGVIASSPVDGIHFEIEMHQKLGKAIANTFSETFAS